MGVLLSPVKGLEVSYPRADLMAQMFHQGTKISIFWNHDSHIFALPEVCFVIIMRCPPPWLSKPQFCYWRKPNDWLLSRETVLSKGVCLNESKSMERDFASTFFKQCTHYMKVFALRYPLPLRHTIAMVVCFLLICHNYLLSKWKCSHLFQKTGGEKFPYLSYSSRINNNFSFCSITVLSGYVLKTKMQF